MKIPKKLKIGGYEVKVDDIYGHAEIKQTTRFDGKDVIFGGIYRKFDKNEVE